MFGWLARPPAWAGFDEGMAAWQRNDFDTALREWLPLAKQGDTNAQYHLGNFYSQRVFADGTYTLPSGRTLRGRKPKFAEAVRWYRAAADKFHAAAQYELGSMYNLGRGVPRDEFEASRLITVPC